MRFAPSLSVIRRGSTGVHAEQRAPAVYRATVVTRTLAFVRGLEPRTALTASDAVRFALWPIAIMTVLQRVLITAVNGYMTDDFKPVYNASLAFLNHRAVYGENLDTVNPHYLYPPGGTLLIAPLAEIDPARSRYLFILVNTIAIVIAWYLLLRMFDITLRSTIAPVTLFALFITETVVNTLRFTNINGCILLGEIVFLRLLLRRRDLWAGAALGLTLVIKPILFPLLLVVVARAQWKALVTALGVPVALTALAWPLTVDPTAFLHRTMPYMVQVRDYANSSIVGISMYFGVPDALAWAVRLLLVAVTVVSLWLLYRYFRHDEVFFVCTATGVLMTALFLLSSLGQQYYSMLIFPMLMTVLLDNSVMRNWPAWLAVFGFCSYDQWLSHQNVALGRYLEYLRITFGWALLLVVVFCVLGERYLTARRNGLTTGGVGPTLPTGSAASALGGLHRPEPTPEPVGVES